MKTFSHQRGMSFVSLIFVGAIVFSLLILVVKIVPAYIEYGAVKKLMYQIGDAPNFATMSNEDIAKAFDKGANISYISSVKSSDLTIDETTHKVLVAEYQVGVHLVANVSLLMQFKASTEH